jgi:hypothetical protein
MGKYDTFAKVTPYMMAKTGPDPVGITDAETICDHKIKFLTK